MRRFVNPFLSGLLLLCFSVTVIPFSLFHHHHEDEEHCDASDVAHESNPCHVSIYHANEVEKPKCKHEAHFSEKQIDCELCKIIISDRSKYVVAGGDQIWYDPILPDNVDSNFAEYARAETSVLFNRGPPA